MKFIKGKWYKITGDSFRKCVEVTKTKSLLYSEAISYGQYTKRDDLCGRINRLTLANYEEYSKFLPKGHPDLINNDNYEIF